MIVWVQCSTVCLCDGEASFLCVHFSSKVNYMHYPSPELYSFNISTVVICKVIMIKSVFAYYFFLQKREKDFDCIIDIKNVFFCFCLSLEKNL